MYEIPYMSLMFQLASISLPKKKSEAEKKKDSEKIINFFKSM